MRIRVFEPFAPLNQPTPHNCSRKRAKAALCMKIAVRVGQNAIRLLRHSWQEAKKIIEGQELTRDLTPKYEHRLEPKIQKLTPATSPWLRYLNA